MIKFSQLIFCLIIFLHVDYGHTGNIKYERVSQGNLQKSKTSLEALVQKGPDSEAWENSLVNTNPTKVFFRWNTEYKQVGQAEWEVSEDVLNWKVIARGNAKISVNKKQGNFSVDFKSIVGEKAHRPLQYYIRIVTYKSQQRAAANKPSTQGLKRMSDDRMVREATKTEKRKIKIREKAGLPSPVLSLTYVSPGDMTTFSSHGLNPALLTAMPIEISLDTLKIKGEGGDEDPYLIVVAMFADGTTIIPELDFTTKTIRFTNSSVRLRSPTKTHGNVAGDNVDVVVLFDIPPATENIKTTIRPIGAQFLNQIELSEAQLRELRQNTLVGLLVIGMEEDALPSTEVINETRSDILNTLQNELDNLVQGVSVDILNPTQLPNLVRSAIKIARDLQERLLDRAMDRGLDEFAEKLIFLGFPTIIVVPGAINADDYIGSRIAVFSYEDILNAGPQGLAIDMQLNQRWERLPRYLQGDTTESIWYHVKGRVRLRQ